MKKRILIIDDDTDICLLLSKFLMRKGYDTDTAYSGAKGIAMFAQENYDAVLCDYRLGDKDGKDVLAALKEKDAKAIVIVITGYSDIKTAVEIIKAGAYDYITKPLIPDEVVNVLSAAFNQSEKGSITMPASSSVKTPARKASTTSVDFMIGNATSTKELYRQIEIVAPTAYSIILYGESGTGKEVVARTIHDYSDRRDKPFVAVDCGTLSKELSGSELFGHVKGAFTGALNDKEGHFETANGGTLFLDEVANLSPDIQASLLRVIQERKFKRVGGNKEMDIDIRILVASNENLQDAYRKGKFREDLYHRFNEFSINLPPLRNRKDDIISFANFFLAKTNTELNKEVTGFDDKVINMFLSYNWPGNLREFRNVVRRSVLLTPGGTTIKADTLPWEITGSSQELGSVINESSYLQNGVVHNNGAPAMHTENKDLDLKSTAVRAEYETIMNLLKQVNYNKKKAAEILNIDRKTLYNKIRNYEQLTEKLN
ncbi:sigma-54-dependent Fis family transcriptional regulator [Panacibacter ginsenosidivorans]|uniref:Sigma-54-dependent Fis family transcriptional regulator n=1 Tax=Panacibacter ginsenosidivorans TaxID=1813871 RepID=A0A5B8V9U1_9BACT|nr:sigma-54 dependent transcriptional regulator [Panacibacter ginsenosidivorans]QEC67693.1 sigma-54-dependent Fis family transcriptional regulator [Panacibacter ginsenosidivorans]